ncbi:MAG: phosphoglucomutase/phosphomannomutase family protein [Leptolyngbya sp.]|nr:phosphoglucomutase/phosphomannomutase family protein [Candidatus Melainabacteria bacterium]
MSDKIKFGTDGWRAIIAEQFTFENVERVAYAVGLYIKKEYDLDEKSKALHKPVLIGYDTRFLADKFAERAGQILISMGLSVRLVDRDVPTPCIAYAAQNEPTAGAIQFTASHNPPEYCGIKYIPHYGGPATNDITNKITEHLDALPKDYLFDKGKVARFDPMPVYLDAIRKFVDLEKLGASKIKVGYDALFSTSRGYLDKLIIEAGLPLHVLHDHRDPLFGGGMPEPKAEFLTELSQLIKREKLDVGIATDGDADRFGVIDETGTFLSANQLLCLLTRHLVKNHGMSGAIVRNVGTTHLLDRQAKLYGLELIETPVGFKWIGEVMRQKDVLIGGEESGGVSVKGHIPEKDGILANLLVLEMMEYEKKPLSQIWKMVVDEVGSDFYARRGDLHIPQSAQKALMERLKASPPVSIAGEKVVKVGRSDGLKLYLDDFTWILIRPSGTEPLMRLSYESSDETRVKTIMTEFEKYARSVLLELNQPEPAVAAGSHSSF